MKTCLALALLCLTAVNAWSNSKPGKEQFLIGGVSTDKNESSRLITKQSVLEANLITEMNRLDIQYKCSEVKIVYHNNKSGHRSYCRASLYCTPRTLIQKQILSLQRACEKEAREECFQKEFLDYLEAFEHTKFTYKNTPKCETK